MSRFVDWRINGITSEWNKCLKYKSRIWVLDQEFSLEDYRDQLSNLKVFRVSFKNRKRSQLKERLKTTTQNCTFRTCVRIAKLQLKKDWKRGDRILYASNCFRNIPCSLLVRTFWQRLSQNFFPKCHYWTSRFLCSLRPSVLDSALTSNDILRARRLQCECCFPLYVSHTLLGRITMIPDIYLQCRVLGVMAVKFTRNKKNYLVQL